MPVVPRGARGSRRNSVTRRQYGFPRSSRLTRRAEFNRVFARGKRTRTRYFTLIAAPAQGTPRLGMAIGRRSAARAVVRNRMKRVIRETFRGSSLPACDVVVLARLAAAKAGTKALRDDLKRGFESL